MKFRNFDQKMQLFSLIRIFTDYYLASSKTNAIPTKLVSLSELKTAKYGYFDCTRDILQIHVRKMRWSVIQSDQDLHWLLSSYQ